MTREVNAAVEGALAAGADEVIVNDSHESMRNLVPEELHPEVRYSAGNDKPLVMMQGVEEVDMKLVFFTGYHARAGTPGGPLAHTWNTWINDVRFNGESTGEYGLNAAIAGHFQVPIGLVTGDDRAVEQTRQFLGEQVVGAVVKHGYSHSSARHIHPDDAYSLIRDAAERAVRNIDEMRVYRLPANVTVEVDLDHQSRVSHCVEIPGVERAGWRTLTYQPKDAIELLEIFRTITRAGGSL